MQCQQKGGSDRNLSRGHLWSGSLFSGSVQWPSEIKLWEEKEPKLTLESSSPGFSPTSICLLGSGSFSLLIITSTREKAKEMKGDEIQMNRSRHLGIA